MHWTGFYQEYPDCYQLIIQPIARPTLQKRLQSDCYNVRHCREDWRLMFNTVRAYNQGGSWAYIDAEEIEKVFSMCSTNGSWPAQVSRVRPPRSLRTTKHCRSSSTSGIAVASP